ncbi:MAG TPA: DUF1810 family protein [Planctomycetota bacterium]|nr:DUF1810 family protein [Planctomycetota bacterium]
MMNDERKDRGEFDHFVRAQAAAYHRVLRELGIGRYQSHWIWFIFPQLRALAYSSASYRYGIASLAQAERYLKHELLSPRLCECTQMVLDIQGQTAKMIFRGPHYHKFQASMTLFSLCIPANSLFAKALDKYFAGRRHSETLIMIQDDEIGKSSG